MSTIGLGNPPQTLQVAIDTGSADLIVNTARSCQGTLCLPFSTYDTNASSTAHYINSNLYAAYGDNSNAYGDYVAENVQIAGSTLQGLRTGVNYNGNVTYPVWGVGYPGLEASVRAYNTTPYLNAPLLMVSEGLIQSAAYSLWLNDLDSSGGSILFGGVDTAKFQPPLQTVPILRKNGQYSEFLVTLSGMLVSGPGIQGSFNKTQIPVLLDSGSQAISLPESLVDPIYNAFGVFPFENQPAINCSLANSPATIDFSFSGAVISMPIGSAIIKPTPEYFLGQGLPANTTVPAGVCAFQIVPSSSTPYILGDAFLRSAYVVYDLANNEISLAQAIPGATGSNIMEIGSGSAGVVGAINATGGVGLSPTGSGTTVYPTASITVFRGAGAKGMRMSLGGVVLGLMGVGLLFMN